MMCSVWTVGTALQAPGSAAGAPVDFEQMKGVLIFYAFLFVLGVAINILLLVRFVREPGEWVVKVNRLLWRPWSWNDIAYVVFIVLVLHLLVLVLVRGGYVFGWWDAWDDRHVFLVAHSVALHWAAILIVFVRMRGRRMPWSVAFSYSGDRVAHGAGKGVVAYVAAVPALIFYAALYHFWLQWTGHDPSPQDVIQLFAELDSGFMYVYVIFLALVVAPVAEELLFRGILLPSLGRRWGLGAAIVISSVLFAVMHFHVPSLVPLFVFSVALSLAYVYTESIVVPIVMHMLFNAVSLTVMMQLG